MHGMGFAVALVAVVVVVWLVVQKSGRPSRNGPGASSAPVRSATSVAEVVRQQKEQVDRDVGRLVSEIDAEVNKAWRSTPRVEPPQAAIRPIAPGVAYRPPKPSGEPVEPWGRTFSYEVVGEFYYQDNIARLVRGRSELDREGGIELDLAATLVAAPDNPHGKGHAVAVWMGGQHVGYIASKDAAPHFAKVMHLRERGKEVVLKGRLWSRYDPAASRLYSRATIWLPAPDGYEPPPGYLPEGPHAVLPSGSIVQVTKEDQHMDVLVRHIVPDRSRSIAVTLHVVEEVRPRSTVEVVEVRVRGERVGVLSPTQSANLRPLVDHLSSAGKTAVARAEVTGNSLKAEVAVFAQKAVSVPQSWLDAHL